MIDILALYFLAMKTVIVLLVLYSVAVSEITKIRSFVPLFIFPFRNGCLQCNVTCAAASSTSSLFLRPFSSFFFSLSSFIFHQFISFLISISIYSIYTHTLEHLSHSIKMATRNNPEAKPRFRLSNPRHGVDRPSPWPVRLLLSG